MSGDQSDNGTGDFEAEEMEKVTRRVSSKQREAMLAYLKKHPKLMKGKGKTPFECQQREASWNTLAKLLNGTPGPKKTPDRWLKSFQDWKSDVRSKQVRRRSGEAGAPLSRNELALLRLLKEDTDDPLDSSYPLNETAEVIVDIKPSLTDLQNGSDAERSASSPEPELETRRSRKRTRDRGSSDRDFSEEKEERAIRAMERQASSLDRMAAAMERIAGAVCSAVERFTNTNNNRPFE